jgi:hypothetical protein
VILDCTFPIANLPRESIDNSYSASGQAFLSWNYVSFCATEDGCQEQGASADGRSSSIL